MFIEAGTSWGCPIRRWQQADTKSPAPSLLACIRSKALCLSLASILKSCKKANHRWRILTSTLQNTQLTVPETCHCLPRNITHDRGK